jgi:hypothetical protein
VVANETRGLALGLLIGGAVSLYLGLNLVATPVSGAPDEVNRMWMGVDTALITALKIVGAALLLAGILCLTGVPLALRVALLAEAGAALVFLSLGLAWLVKWRNIDLYILIMLVMGAMSVAAFMRCLRLHRMMSDAATG